MLVELLYYSPKWLVVEGIRTCWKTQEKSDTDRELDILGVSDINLVRKVVSKGHESTLEHSLFTYRIEGISRACLQELSRHRVGVSPSVESTRFTFNKILRKEEDVDNLLVNTGNKELDKLNREHLEKVKEVIGKESLTNDYAKYGLPEAYKVNQIISFNLRSLRHFYKLRSSNKALWEIRQLAEKLINSLPNDYGIFFMEELHEN